MLKWRALLMAMLTQQIKAIRLVVLTQQIKAIRLVVSPESVKSCKFGCCVSATVMDWNYVPLHANIEGLKSFQH